MCLVKLSFRWKILKECLNLDHNMHQLLVVQILQQEQQYQQEANDEEEEDETGHPEDEEERDEQEDDGEEEEDEKFQFDVDELNEQERQLLVAYLQEEYEKNPDTFQIPKEKLQELINAQLNMRGDNQQYGDEQEDEDG